MSADAPAGRGEAVPRDPLQLMLAEAWRTALGGGTIHIDRTFAGHGGTADQCARMLELTAEACGRPVPPPLRRADVTIEELAATLRRAAPPEGRRSRAFVARNVGPDATRPPFFFLHGDYGGGGLYCLQLAIHLGREQPLYAIAPHGLEGEALPASIEAMAAEHVALVRELRRAGPYRLGGHCNGALVAFEMARQLAAQGERVDRLVLVAPVLLGPGVTSPRNASLRAFMLAAARRARALAARIAARQPRGRGATPDVRPTGSDIGVASARRDAWTRVNDEYARLMRAYQPLRYPGAMTIFQPRDDTRTPAPDPSQVWRPLADRVEVRQVPGAHLSCITVHVREVALHIRACLEGGTAPA